MKHVVAVVAAVGIASASLWAQEPKPVPKNSVRVSIPGCTKGLILTAGRPTEDQAGSLDVPEGTHVRMTGDSKLLKEIRAHEGSYIVVIGLMKRGQQEPGGMPIGGGMRIGPGTGPNGGITMSAGQSQSYVDVEGWRPGVGECPRK